MKLEKFNKLIPLADADLTADKFEEILKSKGIIIANGSDLEHGCLILRKMRELHETQATDEQWKTLREDIQQALGCLQIINLVVKHEGHPSFSKLIPHLRKLSNGSVSQASPALICDQVSDKIFELLVGLVAMNISADVELDDPDSSSNGKNPDVLCRLSSGQTWAFACKVIKSEAPMTLFENLIKGIEQIETSKADIGIVSVCFKNVLPHDEIFPVISADMPKVGCHRGHANISSVMSHCFQKRIDDMVNHVTKEEVWKELRCKKALPGILGVLATVAPIRTQYGPVPSTIAFLHTVKMEFSPLILKSMFDSSVEKTLASLNEGLFG